MQEALARGRRAWRVPIGYVNGNPRAGEPDPERAALIRTAFQRVASGRDSVAQVLRTVTASGRVTRTGHAVTPQTFSALLRNRIRTSLTITLNHAESHNTGSSWNQLDGWLRQVD